MTIKSIMEEGRRLSPEEREKLLASLMEEESERKQERPRRRIPDRHRGAIRVAPDFDDPLADKFWLGEEYLTQGELGGNRSDEWE